MNREATGMQTLKSDEYLIIHYLSQFGYVSLIEVRTRCRQGMVWWLFDFNSFTRCKPFAL